MQIYSPIITGSLDITGSVTITGSLKVSSGITGSLLGTASYALNNPTFAGSNNYIPRFSGSNAIINSAIYNNGSLIGINTVSPAYALDVNGTIRSTQYVYIGGGSNSEYSIEIGKDRSGNGYAYVDLVGDSTYTDYGLRIIRGATGANTTSNITHRGTGTFTIETLEQGSISFNTNNSRRLLIDGTGSLTITGSGLKIDIPSKTNGYVLTSDASGNATWQLGAASFPYSGSAIITGSLSVNSPINNNPLFQTSLLGTRIYNLADGTDAIGNRQSYILTTNLSNNYLYYQSNPTASSAEQINVANSSDLYIKPLELEQSKHTTINIYNFLNFS